MKTDTNMSKWRRDEINRTWKLKNNKNDIAMLEEIRRQKREQQRTYRAKQKAKNKKTNIQSHLVNPIKEVNGKNSKQFKKKIR